LAAIGGDGVVSTADLDSGVDSILTQRWDERDGKVVPETDDVALAGGAVKLDATILYADMANSTILAWQFDARTAAKIMKSFLYCASRLISDNGGEIRSFDGDRVMGIFVEGAKNTAAAKAGLQIKYAVNEIIKPKVEKQFPSLTTKGFVLAHAVGIDTSPTFAVRAGRRGSNDLIWIGRAAGIAAMLSSIREDYYRTYITDAVYGMLLDTSKYKDSTTKTINMWEPMAKKQYGLTIWKSNYHWKP
jgi:adenylate cyclase